MNHSFSTPLGSFVGREIAREMEGTSKGVQAERWPMGSEMARRRLEDERRVCDRNTKIGPLFEILPKKHYVIQ